MIERTNPFTLHSTLKANQNLDHLADEQLKWGDMNNYVIHRKLGRGTYAQVFEGTDIRTNQRIAIKVLLPIRKQKIKREYQILKSLSHPNICKIKDIVKSDELQTTSFILQLCKHQDFRSLYPTLSLIDIKNYMRQLFNALDHMHSLGIMHRDIKPFNVLIDPSSKKLKIVDFGISQFYYQNKEYPDQVGSLYYRAPELMLGLKKYDYKIDCWAAGLILAGMLFKKTPFLYGKDPIDQLIKMMKLLGTQQIVEFIQQKGLTKKEESGKPNICSDVLNAYEAGQIIMAKKSSFQQFINAENKANCSSDALDLLQKLLVLDYKQRYSAKDALKHPFLKS